MPRRNHWQPRAGSRRRYHRLYLRRRTLTGPILAYTKPRLEVTQVAGRSLRFWIQENLLTLRVRSATPRSMAMPPHPHWLQRSFATYVTNSVPGPYALPARRRNTAIGQRPALPKPTGSFRETATFVAHGSLLNAYSECQASEEGGRGWGRARGQDQRVWLRMNSSGSE